MTKRYVFGPVASRRLGVSLGVDLVTRKSCSLNCVYCEAGETTRLTSERREYVPVADVIAQLDEVLKAGPQLDFITFSGAGEPTLNSGIGQVAAFLKKKYPQYTICLLTNAVAFSDPGLLDEITGIDLVVPSLDASNEEEFDAINRPAPGVTFAGLLAGLEHFCRTTRAKVYLELFIVPGVNDSDASIARFAAIIRKLKVDKVQLNTLDRPGCVDWVKPSTAANTRRFIAALEPIVPVEAVGPFKYKSAALRGELPENGVDVRILDLASRRPVTVDDLAVALGAEKNIIAVRLAELVHRGLLESERQDRGEFFRATGPEATQRVET